MVGNQSNTLRVAVSAMALLAGLGAGTTAYAQESDTGPWLDLGQITLFGSGLETTVMQSPSSVTVLDEGSIERIPPESTADLLRTVPGVRVDDNDFGRIRIRGEGGNRVLIKIDGQALTDHTDYGTPLLIDPTTIERIEIVRGSSSVVSGARAIGGVVNIITKGGGDKPFEGSISAGYFSATGGYRANLSLAGRQGAFDYRLSLGTSDRGDRDSPNGTLIPSDQQDQNKSLHLGYTSGTNYYSFKFQDFDLSANVYTGTPGFDIKLPKRDLTKGAFYYSGTDLTPWISSLDASVYHQTVDREFEVSANIPLGPPPAPVMNVLSQSVDEQITSGFNLDAVLEFAPGHRTSVGLEFEDDSLDSVKTTTTTVFGPPTVAVVSNKARIQTFSFYGQHEADLGNNLTGFLGARYYKVNADLEATSSANPLASNSDSRILGSAGLVWTPSEQLALRVNINQGYSYPTLVQMFLQTTARGVTLTGNPNLNPETSTTAEIGARFDSGATVLDAALFFTEAKDYIDIQSTGPRTGTYVNVDGATSFGLELYAERAIAQTGLTPYVSATFMRRKFEYGTGVSTYDSGAPELFGELGMRYDWQLANGVFGNLDANIRGESGTVLRNSAGAVVARAGGYTTFNIAANAVLSDNLNLTASFNNILNKSYEPMNGLPGAERNINLFLTYTF